MIWRVGLSNWIIDDGNYDQFEVGDQRSFALEYTASKELAYSRNGHSRSAQKLFGSNYKISGVVTHTEGWNVLDFGVLAYSNGRTIGAKIGDAATGEIYLGIDPYFYFESYPHEPGTPALIYDWRIVGIEEETTPWLETDRVFRRDESRRSWREVTTTNLPKERFGREFVLHCDLLGGPSLKNLLPRG